MTRTRPSHRWSGFVLLGITYFITTIDMTIVNVSLPTIGRDLHFGETSLQWVTTAYALTFGGFLLLGGRFADQLGRRRILMSGLAVFTGASLGCALAAGEALLIAMRAVQGIGAALMLPAALSIVTTMFEQGAERNQALAIWGALGAAGGTVGLIAGGVITRYLGWEYIFYLNVPIGIAMLALMPRLVPNSHRAVAGRRFDVAGAVTAAANVTGLLLGASFFAFVFAGTLFMQEVLRYSALQTGAAWLTASVTSMALAGVSQKLVTRIGAKPVMAGGMTLIAGGIIWATRIPVHAHFLPDLAGPFLVAGAGTAFTFIPISVAALEDVGEDQSGLASGLLNTSTQFGAAIGTAIASSVAASGTKALLRNGDSVPTALAGGFHETFWVLATTALVAPVAVAALSRRRRPSRAAQPNCSRASATR
jgi:MFS family permease